MIQKSLRKEIVCVPIIEDLPYDVDVPYKKFETKEMKVKGNEIFLKREEKFYGIYTFNPLIDLNPYKGGKFLYKGPDSYGYSSAEKNSNIYFSFYQNYFFLKKGMSVNLNIDTSSGIITDYKEMKIDSLYSNSFVVIPPKNSTERRNPSIFFRLPFSGRYADGSIVLNYKLIKNIYSIVEKKTNKCLYRYRFS